MSKELLSDLRRSDADGHRVDLGESFQTVFVDVLVWHLHNFFDVTDERVAELFARSDSDGSGLLNFAELQKSFGSMKLTVTIPEIQAMVQHIGANYRQSSAAAQSEGYIGVAEFGVLYMQLRLAELFTPEVRPILLSERI